MIAQYIVPTVNFAGLMALIAVAFGFVVRTVPERHTRHAILGGILGLGAVLVSLQPVMVINGIQIDPRNLLVGCAGAFVGPLAGAITFAMAAATRYYESGQSANVCVVSLLVATCAGLLWRRFTHANERTDAKHLIALGLTISLSYICTFLLPREAWAPVFINAVPFLTTTNIIGAVVLGGFLERERRRAIRERRLQHQANIDPLTGLWNRRAFEDAYATSVLHERSAGTAFVLIDLDHFKRVNDTHGHVIGDKVLVAVAAKLCACLRDADLTARFGGEEFAVCLPNTDREQTIKVVKRLRQAVTEACPAEVEAGLAITASIGVCWRENAIRLETAFTIADQALYQAKASGRNQAVFCDLNGPFAKTKTLSRHPDIARQPARLGTN